MIQLNVGSGYLPIPGWVNIDLAEDVLGADIVADCSNLDMFDDNSVDEVFAKDVLEHMPRVGWRDTLDEWARVLRPSGLMKIRFPDIIKLYEAYLRGSYDPNHVYGGKKHYPEKEARRWAFDRFVQLLFGLQDFRENTHTAGLCDWIVREYLESIDMKIINEFKDGCCDIRITASKGEPDQSIILDHPDYGLK